MKFFVCYWRGYFRLLWTYVQNSVFQLLNVTNDISHVNYHVIITSMYILKFIFILLWIKSVQILNFRRLKLTCPGSLSVIRPEKLKKWPSTFEFSIYFEVWMNPVQYFRIGDSCVNPWTVSISASVTPTCYTINHPCSLMKTWQWTPTTPNGFLLVNQAQTLCVTVVCTLSCKKLWSQPKIFTSL